MHNQSQHNYFLNSSIFSSVSLIYANLKYSFNIYHLQQYIIKVTRSLSYEL